MSVQKRVSAGWPPCLLPLRLGFRLDLPDRLQGHRLRAGLHFGKHLVEQRGFAGIDLRWGGYFVTVIVVVIAGAASDFGGIAARLRIFHWNRELDCAFKFRRYFYRRRYLGWRHRVRRRK